MADKFGRNTITHQEAADRFRKLVSQRRSDAPDPFGSTDSDKWNQVAFGHYVALGRHGVCVQVQNLVPPTGFFDQPNDLDEERLKIFQRFFPDNSSSNFKSSSNFRKVFDPLID